MPNFLGEILQGYLTTALWTAEFDNEDVSDIDKYSTDSAIDDIKDFLIKLDNENLLAELREKLEDSDIGHNFWLTRNGHGAGFWDKGLGQLGDDVSKICRKFGEKYIYKGDDEKIYID